MSNELYFAIRKPAGIPTRDFDAALRAFLAREYPAASMFPLGTKKPVGRSSTAGEVIDFVTRDVPYMVRTRVLAALGAGNPGPSAAPAPAEQRPTAVAGPSGAGRAGRPAKPVAQAPPAATRPTRAVVAPPPALTGEALRARTERDDAFKALNAFKKSNGGDGISFPPNQDPEGLTPAKLAEWKVLSAHVSVKKTAWKQLVAATPAPLGESSSALVRSRQTEPLAVEASAPMGQRNGLSPDRQRKNR